MFVWWHELFGVLVQRFLEVSPLAVVLLLLALLGSFPGWVLGRIPVFGMTEMTGMFKGEGIHVVLGWLASTI